MRLRQSKMPATQTSTTTLAPNFSTKICSGRKTCVMTADQCAPCGFAFSDEIQSAAKASRRQYSCLAAQPHHVIEASLIILIIQVSRRKRAIRFWLDVIQHCRHPEATARQFEAQSVRTSKDQRADRSRTNGRGRVVRAWPSGVFSRARTSRLRTPPGICRQQNRLVPSSSGPYDRPVCRRALSLGLEPWQFVPTLDHRSSCFLCQCA